MKEKLNKELKKIYFEKNKLMVNKVVFTIAVLFWTCSALSKILKIDSLSNMFADYTYFTLVVGTILLLFNK